MMKLLLLLALATQHPAMPPGMTHEEHLAQMEKEKALKERGAAAMGFDQDKATHHFRLTGDGGAIEVTASDAADRTTAEQIRAHLTSVANEFAAGDYGKPRATHGEVPPGTKTMHARQKLIAFSYEELPAGGRVRIASADRRAVDAVHEFLRYQIAEHRTGDATTVSR